MTGRVLAVMALFVLVGMLIPGVRLAVAVPVQWHLRGVVFDDGTTATGVFTFDADPVLLVSGWDIVTEPGLTVREFHYTPTTTVAHLSDSRFCFSDDNPGEFNLLCITPSSPLTNAGGDIPIDTSCGGGCNTSFEDYFDSLNQGHTRAVTAGEVSSVPEPGTVLLVGSGLLGLAAATWKRRRKPVVTP